MNWDTFNSHNHSFADAFEMFCTQLFERYLRREYATKLARYAALSGSGGDGGVEAYGELTNEDIIGLQAKWFRSAITKTQIAQIKSSVITAKNVRPALREYIICVPKKINSVKLSKGAKPTSDDEEKRLINLAAELKKLYPKLKLTWWFDDQLLNQLQFDESSGINRYWFERSVLFQEGLIERFQLQKTNSWLKSRYAPDLNGQGKIAEVYNWSSSNQHFKVKLIEDLEKIDHAIESYFRLSTSFLATDEIPADLQKELEEINQNLKQYQAAAIQFQTAVKCNNFQYSYRDIPERSVWETHLRLDQFAPTNIQKAIIGGLSKKLERMHQMYLNQYLAALNDDFHKSIFLIYGAPGTGKTQGLAHSVYSHLTAGKPALIIPAFGAPNANWTTILSSALELPGWTKDQVFSALEAMAVSRDHQKPLKNKKEEIAPTNVLIAVDGLEEDWTNKQAWYDRISECREIVLKYPRLRFFFSAREYFHDHDQVSEKGPFEIVHLPKQGDISISEAAAIYFRLEHFNIQLDDPEVLNRINSLYTLKLFCERYQGKHILKSQQVSTVQRDLLNDKVNHLNVEFFRLLNRPHSKSQQPVTHALSILSRVFYQQPQLEHGEAVSLLQPELKGYAYDELGLLLDFLADYGVLIRSIRETDELISRDIFYYNIAYQSIIEHVLSEETVHLIVNNKLDHIPAVFFSDMVRPLDDSFNIEHPFLSPNEAIIQSIFNRIFADTGKLVGVDGFLSRGLSASGMLKYQLSVLVQAPKSKALNYKDFIDGLFRAEKIERYTVFHELILPSTSLPEPAFGIDYFHQVMMAQPSVFARDTFLWEGKNGRKRNFENDLVTIELALTTFTDPINLDIFRLSVTDRHDQMPLIFAWCLSTLDQSFRDNIRKALVHWAHLNCAEYILLLNKVFFCNDPQIQEDFAAITVGLANTLTQNIHIKQLAEWSLENIFTDTTRFYSVIIRTGFRAIVEKAHSKKLIDAEKVLKCRAGKAAQFNILQLDEVALQNGKEQIYPIVSDLAWYVIKDVYHGFFENNYSEEDHLHDVGLSPDLIFLKHYALIYHLDRLGLHQWTMAAAIAYIKDCLGLTRASGNGHTTASHGSKSEVFTYEEKYTWLAVTYLQGYVADQLPYKTGYIVPQFLPSYDLITVVPDTLEQNPHAPDARQVAYMKLPKWIIPENLTSTINRDGGIQSNAHSYIRSEPVIDFGKWLTLDTTISNPGTQVTKWIAILQNTMLNDKTNTVYTRLVAPALLIKKTDFEDLKQIVLLKPESIHEVMHIEGIHASTDTDTYSNPADIVWMNWIDETDETTYFNYAGKEYELDKTVLEVINSGQDGEQYHYLPSKKVRKILKIKQLQHRYLVSGKNKITGIIFNAKVLREPDRQIITWVDRLAIDQYLESKGMLLFWFAEVFRRTTLEFEQEEDDSHLMRTRKYLVWEENGIFQSLKFWDARFSNSRRDE